MRWAWGLGLGAWRAARYSAHERHISLHADGLSPLDQRGVLGLDEGGPGCRSGVFSVTSGDVVGRPAMWSPGTGGKGWILAAFESGAFYAGAGRWSRNPLIEFLTRISSQN